MATWELISHPDIWRAIQSHKKTKTLQGPKLPFSCKAVLDDKVYKKIQKDPLLQEKIQLPCTKLYKEMVAKMSGTAQNYDKAVQALITKVEDEGDIVAAKQLQKINPTFEAALKKIADEYSKKMIAAAEKGWKDYVKLKADLKKFKIKVAVDFALRGLGVAVNALKIAVSGPVGIVFAVQGTVKDLVKTANDLYLIFRNMTMLTERLQTGAQDLAKRLAGGAGKTGEALASFVSGITGYCGKTGTQLLKELKFYKARAQQYEKDTHSLAKKLNKLLDEAKKMAKELPANFASDLKLIENEVRKVINEVRARVQQVKAYYTFQSDTQKQVEGLMKDAGLKNLPTWIKRFETVVDVAKSATGAALTDGEGWKDVTKTLLKVEGYVVTLGKNVERHYKGISDTVAKATV